MDHPLCQEADRIQRRCGCCRCWIWVGACWCKVGQASYWGGHGPTIDVFLYVFNVFFTVVVCFMSQRAKRTNMQNKKHIYQCFCSKTLLGHDWCRWDINYLKRALQVGYRFCSNIHQSSKKAWSVNISICLSFSSSWSCFAGTCHRHAWLNFKLQPQDREIEIVFDLEDGYDILPIETIAAWASMLCSADNHIRPHKYCKLESNRDVAGL